MAEEDLVVNFRADLSNFQGGINKAKSTLDDFRDNLGKMSSSIGNIGAASQQAGDQTEAGFSKATVAVEKYASRVVALAVAPAAYLLGIGLAATKVGAEIRLAAGAFDQTSAAIGGVKAVADASGVGLDSAAKAIMPKASA